MAEVFEPGRVYGPNDGQSSSIGPQILSFYFYRKALVDLKKHMFFSQLADTISMPKHFGRTIKVHHYIPLLDDRNINDQGINAVGLNITDEVTITITDPSGMTRYAVGTGTDAATALTAAQARAVDIFKNIDAFDTDYNTTKAALIAAGWTVDELAAVNSSGNLYGSSRDVGTVAKKLPVIGDNGGRVNRVGFTRLNLEATLEPFGFFDEYNAASMDFDDDYQLNQHISRETLRAANYIYEDTLQIDLLNGANVVYYGGNATSTGTVTAEGTNPSVLSYDTLIDIDNVLNNVLCPKDTTIIAGSTMINTRTVAAARYAYVGSELKKSILKMDDFHGERAFIPVQQYAKAGDIAHGEIGSIAYFRFIENPQMLHWDGAGAAVTTNPGYREANGHYNVYPVLVVGSGSFTTVGFQMSGTSGKFRIIHKKPGIDMANQHDPYGVRGFYSIRWYYGTLIWRPEWIALIKVVAEK